jgi:cardiolipin synthase
LRSLALLILWSLTSCASAPPMPEGFGGYVALEAWRGESSLNIKYMGPDGLVYSLADWRDELAEGASLPDAVSVVVVNPDETGREPWPKRPRSARRLAVLHATEYFRFRNSLISDMVPQNGRDAIVVSLGNEEVALFFDSKGRFQSVLGAPPEGIGVTNRYSLEDYLASAPTTLEALLDEMGIDAGEVLFNTGDLGEDALPFLYANVDTRVGAFVRVQPLGTRRVNHETLVPITQSITHFVRSHTTSLANRAVSSLARLMFVVTHAVKDTFDLAPLLVFESEAVPPLSDSAGMDLAEWEDELDGIVGRPSDTGTLEYLIDGEAFFTRFEAAMRDASQSIFMRTYIFDNDDYALAIADLLRDRAQRGVDVRVLMDGIGTLSALAQPASEQPDQFKPPLSIHHYLESGSDVHVRRVPNPFFSGDHTKTTIIDEKLAYLGGMNIAREYRYEWHDMMVELRGPVVAQLADDFDIAWAGAGPMGDASQLIARLMPKRNHGPSIGYPIRILYTRAMRSEIRNAQLKAIRSSRSYIYLENAYLTDDAFLFELVKARRRGVDVRVVIPLQSDRGQLTRNNIMAANTMFEHGIRVYVYPGMSHIKAAIFDGWACLGSANLDQLSLRVNLETNIATSDPAAVADLTAELFEKDFESSPEMREVFPERWNDRLWELVGDYIF